APSASRSEPAAQGPHWMLDRSLGPLAAALDANTAHHAAATTATAVANENRRPTPIPPDVDGAGPPPARGREPYLRKARGSVLLATKTPRMRSCVRDRHHSRLRSRTRRRDRALARARQPRGAAARRDHGVRQSDAGQDHRE